MKGNIYHTILFYFFYTLYLRVEHACCSDIGLNVFDKGLVIWHPERIIVNSNAKVGRHCSLSSGVVIAQAHDKSPIIGNEVEFMIDSSALGDIVIADHVRIGAKALVIKDIEERNTTWAGLPAKKISDKGTVETPVPIP
ncbi:hypothetical protein [Bifidobacterium ramosum]|uniref:Serine O-acetyltransferase n=2 Tax=Bifidobacterium ramosum TaxID=1798158 RepID=A0A7K3TBV0_9BIFI|nr:hypothetical protein [Bifidobacterium ramosum]NEG71962.1 serine O-acetyltransferase [Bifidobacterium ramosum]